MAKFAGLVPGRIVRYVNGDGRIFSAVVVEVKDDTIDIGMFGRVYSFVENVTYDEQRHACTWHWPPREG